MPNWFYNLGRAMGPTLRKGQWAWQALTGTEEERVETELAVGRDLAAAVRTARELEPAKSVQQRVSELGGKLADATGIRFRHFEFTVVLDDKPNAFALPGGFIFVTRPLLELTVSPDELAFILGHEITHVVEEHALERMVADATIGAAVRRIPVGGAATQWLRSKGGQLLQSAYSRDTEMLTDRLGARLSMEAGFDPRAATKMLDRLNSAVEEDTNPLAPYFATHPPIGQRIAELNRYLGKK